MDDGAAGTTSIGQGDQLRDREMLRDERKQQSVKEDTGPDTPDDRPTGGAAPRPREAAGETAQDWHPGDAEQPDRAASPGLTGSGPAQPDE